MRNAGPQPLSKPEPEHWQPIVKSAHDRARANMTDYELSRDGFTWEWARSTMEHSPGGGVNIAYEAVDRHLGTPLADAPALIWHGAAGERVTLTYAELAGLSNRFAQVLRGQGVRRGERVCVLLGRTPELFVAVLGAWKAGCVVVPVHSALGPPSVRERLAVSGARTVVTTVELYRRGIAGDRAALPALQHVILTDAGIEDERIDDTIELAFAMANTEAEFPVVHTQFEDPAIVHFTGGASGALEGVVHVHGAVLAHRITARYALDLRPGDIYWCTADPGWMTGMSYGVIAPLAVGATVICDEAEFDALRWYRILTREQVAVWYTGPAQLRMLMRHDDDLPPGTDLSRLRFVASGGEPLDPETVVWTDRVLGHPAHDNWSQTETGSIMIANLAATDIHPGSVGRPLPGVEAAILRCGIDGRAAVAAGRVTIADEGEVGELALKVGWPSMFRGYWHEPERYARAFADGWYLSGELARHDGDGSFWVVGRAVSRSARSGDHPSTPSGVDVSTREISR